MVGYTRSVGNSNETGAIFFQPYPSTNTDLTAGSDYNAATVSGIVFGVFMALLALYSIWQYSRQYSVFVGHMLQQQRRNANSTENLDVEIGTLNSMSSRRELRLVERQDTDETLRGQDNDETLSGQDNDETLRGPQELQS